MENKIIKITLENKMEMDLELYPNVAPLTVENFIKLVNSKYFDGIVFHRIIKDFMAQAGGYLVDEVKKEISYSDEVPTIKGEFKSNGFNNPLKHTKGVISMARTNVKDSASSQFFICTADAPHLDGEYAAFGKVINEEGFKTLEYLNNVPVVNIGNGLQTFPFPIVRILSIEAL